MHLGGFGLASSMTSVFEFGPRLAALRKNCDLSQSSLAEAVGVSQATISRLEASPETPSDIRLLSRVATALDTTILEVLEGCDLPESLIMGATGAFYAFCPNPICGSNEHGRSRDGGFFIRWRSGSSYEAEQFDEVNYCGLCGTELVKECPSCKKRLKNRADRYCVACGSPLSDRPTDEDYAEMERLNPDNDDLPF